MTGTLDRIEERLDGLATVGYAITRDEARALVAVAKAAQEMRDYLSTVVVEQGSAVFGIYQRLDAALARLEDNQ